ncbi:hypothetical protein Droror1_Dr00016059 [Drosera rotundifolia]
MFHLTKPASADSTTLQHHLHPLFVYSSFRLPFIANCATVLTLLNLSPYLPTPQIPHQLPRNKVSIVAAGALKPIIGFLQADNGSLQEHAAASLLTLSASFVNKPIIGVSGAIPLLVGMLEQGSSQAKVDAIMALYNLSTHRENVKLILNSKPVPFIVNLLKTYRKSSKTTEKCVAVLEYVVVFDEARDALVSKEGGVLPVVEVLESGSLRSREHAVGILLTMCEVHLGDTPQNLTESDFENLARKTEGFSGSDIAVCEVFVGVVELGPCWLVELLNDDVLKQCGLWMRGCWDVQFVDTEQGLAGTLEGGSSIWIKSK